MGPTVGQRKGRGEGGAPAAAGPVRASGRSGEGGAGLRLLGREKESGPRGGGGSWPSAKREGFPLFSIFFSIF